jgi:hypothetical protein
METKISTSDIIGTSIGFIVFAIGISNLVWVHPVPGILFILTSLIYLPVANEIFKRDLGFRIPLTVKVILAIVIIWFTLGISDLGDILDKL